MASVLRILVVADRLDTIASLVEQLQSLHHQVDTTNSSMEALSLATRKSSSGQPYHLIISDQNMPLLNGVGLAKELRRRGENPGFAFLSSHGALPSKLRAETAEVKPLGILGRPHHPEEVRQLLARVVLTPGNRQAPPPGPAQPEAFFGTGGPITRTISRNAKPEEGTLARTRLDQRDQAAPVDMDTLLGKPATSPPTQAPAQAPPTTVAPEFSDEAPEPRPTTRRTKAPDPSSFYQPNGTLGTTSAFYKRPKTDPFITAQGMVDPRAATPPPGTTRDPVTGNYRRQPSGLIPGEPHPVPATTSRIRQATSAKSPPNPSSIPPELASFTPLGQPALPPSSGITSGFRRSLSGAGAPPPAPRQPSTTQTCTVACAHCHGLFHVLVKPVAYTVLCVHCGQLNRIDPLPGR